MAALPNTGLSTTEIMAGTSKPASVTLHRLCLTLFISANDDLDIETEAGGTQFEAGLSSKVALTTLMDGNQWMIYRNTITGVLHWDFVRLQRFDTAILY